MSAFVLALGFWAAGFAGNANAYRKLRDKAINVVAGGRFRDASCRLARGCASYETLRDSTAVLNALGMRLARDLREGRRGG